MRLVDDEHGAVAAREADQLDQRGDIAVHREDAVGDDQLGAIAGLLEAVCEVLGVAVAIDERVGAGEPAAVDDAGVVELVGEDDAASPRAP